MSLRTPKVFADRRSETRKNSVFGVSEWEMESGNGNGNGNEDVNMWEMKMGNGIYKWKWE